jgi:hypothetical protein
MLRHRKILLTVTLSVAGGSLYATLGYAAYLHSDLYRQRYERKLQRFLELPASIEAVRPQSYHRVDFLDIGVWLPERRTQVFNCRRAEWHELTGEGECFGLAIRDGRLTVDSGYWQESDYGLVLKSGLGHDFAALHLQYVDLYDVDLVWRSGPLSLAVREATGRIQFDHADEGRISIISHTLNTTTTDEPIHVFARFRPSRDLMVHEVILRAPPLPVQALGLESVLGVAQAHGRFEGRLRYRGHNGRPRIDLAGRAEGIDLLDWTAKWKGGPVHGRINLTIEQADLVERDVVAARFRGRAEGLRLGELTRAARIAPIEGTAELELLNAEFADNRLVRATLRGKATAETLDPLAALIGPGKIAGSLRITINSLEVTGESLVCADIDVEAIPPKDAPATLDTELIVDAARSLLRTELPSLISVPLQRLNTVTYSRLAFKLLADRDHLRVFGSHGPGGRSILTVRMFGTDLSVVTQPERPIELAPVLAWLRSTGEKKVRELVEIYRPASDLLPTAIGQAASEGH